VVPQYDMVAWEMARERERRYERSERLRVMRDEVEDRAASRSIWPVGLMVALVLVVVLGRTMLA
jgi:hypothetical protein